MAAPEAALAEAVRHIREIALRQAMAMCNRLQATEPTPTGYPSEYASAFRHGHRQARMQLYDEIERMIAREVPAAVTAPEREDGE